MLIGNEVDDDDDEDLDEDLDDGNNNLNECVYNDEGDGVIIIRDWYFDVWSDIFLTSL
jgi:hypothetical protein